MKKSLLLGIATIAGLCLISCERNEIAVSDEVTSDSPVYYASIEQPQQVTETKAYVDSDYKVLWHADDHISVFDNYSFNREYRFKGQTGDNAGRFEAVPDDDYVVGNELSHIYAVYPYRESNRVSNQEVITVELPSEQGYAEHSFAQGANTMVSVTDSKNLLFKNACGYLGIKLYGESVSIRKIVLSGNDGELIAGKAEIRMEPGGVPATLVLDEGKEEQKAVTLICDPAVKLGATAEDCTEFWFALPPMTFEKGLSVTIFGSDGNSLVQETEKAITIDRSRITHMAPIAVSMQTPTPEITIDGDFADWAALPSSIVTVARTQPDAPSDAVTEIRACMDEDYVYYYIRFSSIIDELKAVTAETLPIRLNINTDGEFTSGYNSYYLDAYDFMIEGALMSNNSTSFISFNGTLYQRINGAWNTLGKGITRGSGEGREYEIALSRSAFNAAAATSSVPMPMGDVIQTGIRFYTTGTGNWDGLSNLPNAAVDASNPNGYGHLMTVGVGIGSGSEAGQEENLAPQIKSGDRVCATNADVQQFLTDIQYPTHDYSYSSLLTWAEQNNVTVSPGNSDKPAEYTIRWKANAAAGDITVNIEESDRTWVYTASAGSYYVTISNLLPNTHYHYTVLGANDETLEAGSFDTYGKLHQLFFKRQIRNCRDLGGWTTQDGKTIKYRKVYRGGRLEPSYLTKAGKADLVTEGIKAQLDLRGQSDVLAESTLKGLVDDYAFCAPVIEEGYSQMLKNDKEKTRQCIQFIMDCVAADKPVYFHCSLGRDRTGTVAMLTLGILGVPEGDISQEYELTQFAPSGYSVASGEKTKMVRTVDYKGAANVIWGYVDEGQGETFRDGVEKYLLEIGISQRDINAFRANMLE